MPRGTKVPTTMVLCDASCEGLDAREQGSKIGPRAGLS